MAKQASKPEQGRLGIIFDGIKKLYNVNLKFSWFLIIISILGALSNITADENSSSSSPTTSATSTSAGEFVTLGIVFAVIFALIIVIGVFIQGMISYATYSAIQGKAPSIKEAYTATKGKFWILLEVAIRSALKIIGGLLLLIIPGIRAICRYQMAPVAVFDQGTSAKEVMDFSKKQTKDNLLIVFIMLLGSAIIMPLSALIQYGGQVGIYPNLKNKLKA